MPKTISVRASLVRNLTLLIVVVSLTILAVLTVGSRRAVQDLTRQLIEQSSRQAEEQLRSFFGSIEGMIDSSHSWWDAGLLAYADETDLSRVNSVYVPLLDQYPQITSMMLAHDEGFEYLLFRDLRGGDEYEWYNRIVWADRGPDAGFESLWTKGLQLHDRRPLPPEARSYDPRTRPFYSEPEYGETYWTNPYYFFITKDAGITGSYKWHDEATDSTRLVAFDLLLVDLSRFTVEHRPSERGKVFVMLEDGSLLGLPADPRWADANALREALRDPAEKLGKAAVADQGAVLLTARDFGLDAVAAAVEHWSGPHGAAHGVFRFDTDGVSWWGGMRPFELGDRMLWIGVIVPEDDFLSGARRQRNLVLGVCAVALVAAVIMAFLIAKRYSRPLEALATKSARVRELDLTDKRPVQSNLTEIDQLADAHAQMTSALESFSRYVPIDLVRELLRRGEVAKIGGRAETLTILFTDIKGFTDLAERLSPDSLTGHMAEYFHQMLEVLHDEHATVDKFVGDAIVAFWGAPNPDDRHASHAVQSVLRARGLLGDLNRKWQDAGMPPLYTRFGLSTGEAVVGNVGAPDRLNYTVLGDTVNLAARLESLNNVYGTQILASDSVVQAASQQFVWRRIDRVRVKGKQRAVAIHEPLGRTEDVSEAAVSLARRYESALELYGNRDFVKAEALLAEVLQEVPDDGPAARLRDLCRRHTATPPADDWDGTTRFDFK